MTPPATSNRSAFETLRGLSRKRLPQEHCELCSLALPGPHPHVLQRSNGQILCACEPCAILFSHREDAGKFVRIPRDFRRLSSFQITDAEWRALLLPIDLAFFVNSSRAGRVIAYYPSPGGCTESLLNLEAWTDIIRDNPVVGHMQPDVEALLVNRVRDRREYYIAPLDQCYKLAGLIRMNWHGFSGGDSVWQEIDQFFDRLKDARNA